VAGGGGVSEGGGVGHLRGGGGGGRGGLLVYAVVEKGGDSPFGGKKTGKPRVWALIWFSKGGGWKIYNGSGQSRAWCCSKTKAKNSQIFRAKRKFNFDINNGGGGGGFGQ